MLEIFFAFVLGAISCSTAYYVIMANKLKNKFKSQLIEHNKLGDHVNHMLANVDNKLSAIKSQDKNKSLDVDAMESKVSSIASEINSFKKILSEVVHKIENMEANYKNEMIFIRKELERYGV